jgi:uncharacterized Ntn-hydrolase superfamily protein
MRQIFSCSFIAFLLALSLPGIAAATFSIAAVDPGTGEVGSAGASCISGSIILSDVHPGVGVVHTQSFWNSQNQQNARMLMDQGYSPQEIIDWLIANDAQGNPGVRQYGIVDLVDGGRSAAFTGEDCFDWKGHITAPTYAVQGNILLGPEIIADMETAFLNTNGSLADRLMAALQAAKRPMADTRCSNKSAISAFLRVAQPNDPTNDLFLDLNVHTTSGSTDPIDVLQGLYDDWQTSAGVPAGEALTGLRLELPSPNPFSSSTSIVYRLPGETRIELVVIDPSGRRVALLEEGMRAAGDHRVEWQADRAPAGIYVLRLIADGVSRERKLVRLPR